METPVINIANYRAGTPRPSFQYTYFMPNPVRAEYAWEDIDINDLLEIASHHLGELNAYGRLVPDTTLFIQMYALKEAVVSSRIEGTRTGIDQALQEVQDVNPEYRDDWEEVTNYIKAMQYSILRMQELPFSNRLLREAHHVLLQGVRGQHKTPGEYRKSQNWIGGASLKDAVFIPPAVEHVDELMSDLELFLKDETLKTPVLIRAAIGHYQFETIHPFQDGNGRLGRLMITLYLMDTDRLTQPLLYLSEYFERNKSLYYDNLTRVRTHNDLRQWILFFLVGVRDTAQQAVTVLKQIFELKEQVQKDLATLSATRREHCLQLMQYLWKRPLVNTRQVETHLQVSPKTASAVVQSLVQKGILIETTGYKRNRLFSFEAYLSLFR